MWPEPVERVSAFLRAAAVDATVEEFAEGTTTAQSAALAVGCEPGRIVKSLVFICDRAAVLALVPGDRRADEGKIAAAAEAAEVRIAASPEVLAATGFEPGAVAPFPQVAITRTLIDRLLLHHPSVWTGGGSNSHMVAISPPDLQRLTRARVADLVAPR
jgi:prolyl-tRNA editing enzyme YbaK/EbsC (Cys-tRNA(Pro) deacylase)